MGTKARIKGEAITSLPSFMSAKEATKDEMSEGVPRAPRACPEPVEGRPITSLSSLRAESEAVRQAHHPSKRPERSRGAIISPYLYFMFASPLTKTDLLSRAELSRLISKVCFG
jgi:hypothetical protein